MYKEKRNYYETDRCFGLPEKNAKKWECIYLEDVRKIL